MPPVSWADVQQLRRAYTPWPVQTVAVDSTADDLRMSVRTVLDAIR